MSFVSCDFLVTISSKLQEVTSTKVELSQNGRTSEPYTNVHS